MHEQLNTLHELPGTSACRPVRGDRVARAPACAQANADAAGYRRSAFGQTAAPLATAPGLGEHTGANPARTRLHGGRDRRPRPPRRGVALAGSAALVRPDVVEEAGDRLQPIIGRHDAEVGALHQGFAILGRQFPGEADAIVVALDIARAAKAVSGIAFLRRRRSSRRCHRGRRLAASDRDRSHSRSTSPLSGRAGAASRSRSMPRCSDRSGRSRYSSSISFAGAPRSVRRERCAYRQSASITSQVIGTDGAAALLSPYESTPCAPLAICCANGGSDED